MVSILTGIGPDMAREGPLRGKLLVEYAFPIFQNLLIPALSPSNPETLRIDAVLSTSQYLKKMSQSLGYGERIFSFSHWGKGNHLLQESHSLLGKLVVERSISALITAFKDPSDQVRIEAAQALVENANLLLSDADLNKVVDGQREGLLRLISAVYKSDGVEPISAREGAFSGFVPFWVESLKDHAVGVGDKKSSFASGFSNVMQNLFQEMKLCINDENFVSHLDTTFRSLCVLDPAHFEDLVRQEYSACTGEQENTNILQIFSDLISHADILQSLASRHSST